MKRKEKKDVPFLDDEERELIEGYEQALEAGVYPPKSEAELAEIRADWKQALDNTYQKKSVTLRLQERDIERLKVIARQRGLPYQTLVGSILHQYVNGTLREVRD